MKKDQSCFVRIAEQCATFAGSPYAMLIAVGMVVVWGLIGPFVDFSDTWQLVINTTTTIITFLMVFLIQNSQNRDTRAIQVKLDELIRVTKGAHLALLDLEELSDDEIAKIRADYECLAKSARKALKNGGSDTGVGEIQTSRGRVKSAR